MSTTQTLQVAEYVVELSGNTDGFEVKLDTKLVEPGVHELTLELTAAEPRLPAGKLLLAWRQPIADLHARWTPAAGKERGLLPNWGSPVVSRATSQAPVVSLYSQAGENRLTFASSDALNATEVVCGVEEESCTVHCGFRFFAEPQAPLTRYGVTLRLDIRPLPYHEALAAAGRWWESLAGMTPAPVPEAARRPMYSTWYSYHQQLEAPALLEECRLARSLGYESIIVDDGWQTRDNNRGYAFCGDWRPERLTDMRGFVDAVHREGMKVLLWYSVPFVGFHSQNYARFRGKFLREDQRMGAGVLDPRFPEVREFLIGLYETALHEWDLDGFKLDFVDAFTPSETSAKQLGEGRDEDSVPRAADRLLSDIMTGLRAIKPEIMVEFRQSYIGPLMRKYGNMFRAGDCPSDAHGNRLRTLDVRLLCGATAAHSDMFIWHEKDPLESAALQVLNVLFSVPQLSVRLAGISPQHRQMIAFWTGFWNTHRDVLLDGRLEPLHPELLYPVVVASTAEKRLVACYGEDQVIVLCDAAPWMGIVNATRGRRVVLDCPRSLGAHLATVYDTLGRTVSQSRLHLHKGIQAVAIPPAGLLELRKV